MAAYKTSPTGAPPSTYMVPHCPESRIQDYAAIGDCRSAALVSRTGGIDWLCWPRFDSPAIFAALLDAERGGHWRLAPASAFTTERRYLDESNVVATTMRAAAGTVVVTDLMPVASERFKNGHLVPDHEIIRRAECTEGEVEMACDFRPRAQYGLRALRLRRHGALGLRMDAGRGVYWLRSSLPLELRDGRAEATFVMRAGERAYFSLSYAEESPVVLPALGAATDAAIARAVHWWQQWARRCTYQGPHRDAVLRSALALKLLSYAPSGAIIAAPTTSLPELPGAGLNWDYRYCWLRDASLTMRALLGLGYREEAEAFLGWLLHATRLTHPRLNVVYTVFGCAVPQERTLAHLRGYRDSRPVRVGNAARDQLQLDIYGEVVEAAGQFADDGGRLDGPMQRVLRGVAKYVASHWNLPDEGIWEPRENRSHHTYSRLLCWAALDRLLDLEHRGLIRGLDRARLEREREKIGEQLRQRAWSERRGSYVATLDGDDLDASLLQLSWYGFEPADSDRMRATYRVLCRELGAGDGLLFRYRRLPPEGAFGICGFWAVEYLALGGGTLEESRRAFQRLAARANDLGLFSEETDPATGDALGNFPQSFTHVGLVNAALSIEERARRERAAA